MSNLSKKDKFNIISYEKLEKIFIQCEEKINLNKEMFINKTNINNKPEIKIPIISFTKAQNKMKRICKLKLKISC